MGDFPDRQSSPTHDEIVALFCKTDDPVLSTDEIADELASTTQKVDGGLVSLQNSGVLLSKSIGGQYDVWWLAPSFEPDSAARLLDRYQYDNPKLEPDSKLDE